MLRRGIWDVRWLALALLLVLPGVAQAQIEFKPASSGETVTLIPNTNVTTPTTGTAEEVLYTIPLPANSFPSTYSGVIIRAVWQHANNANSATGRIRIDGIGGTLVASRATSSANEFLTYEVQVRVLSATSVVFRSMYWQNTTIAATASAEVSLTLTNAINVVVTGICPTAAGDIVLRQVSASWIK